MTRGLGITPSTTSDNLTPQETTTQDTGTVGADGAGFSCPGSTLVANSEGEGARFEAPTVPETISPDSTSSFQSQSLAEGPEVDGQPMKPRWTRWFCHSLATILM